MCNWKCAVHFNLNLLGSNRSARGLLEGFFLSPFTLSLHCITTFLWTAKRKTQVEKYYSLQLWLAYSTRILTRPPATYASSQRRDPLFCSTLHPSIPGENWVVRVAGWLHVCMVILAISNRAARINALLNVYMGRSCICELRFHA
jgi:hypothetical protein